VADTRVRLAVLLGPTIPRPAPAAVVDALVAVEVQAGVRETDTFRLSFSLAKDRPSDYGLLLDGALEPMRRLALQVSFGTVPEVLIDGVITDQQVQPSNQPGESVLVVTGEDVSVLMDLKDRTAEYPEQTDSNIVEGLLGQYARHGLRSDVTSTSRKPGPNQQHQTQQGKDLRFIRWLAGQNGFVFYVEPTLVPGTSTAHWGKDDRGGRPQTPLTMNMGAATNVDRPISFRFNALGPLQPVTRVARSPDALVTVPPPALPEAALTARPATAVRDVELRNVAGMTTSDASLQALQVVAGSADAVIGTGQLDAVRYRRLLRARRPVAVRGAGATFDGDYMVRQVTHLIRRGSYAQSFVLGREGRGAKQMRVAT
jgi:hypothetical protein